MMKPYHLYLVSIGLVIAGDQIPVTRPYAYLAAIVLGFKIIGDSIKAAKKREGL